MLSEAWRASAINWRNEMTSDLLIDLEHLGDLLLRISDRNRRPLDLATTPDESLTQVIRL